VRPWNHNIHYHGVLLAARPERCERALDVGCGEGILTRDLRAVVPHVTGIDVVPECIELARREDPEGDYRLGDFLREPLEPASFDLVTCAAALHHMDPAAALGRMAELVRPGGVVAILGLARSTARDLPLDAAAALASRAHRIRKGWWSSPAPRVWPAPHTYAEMRELTRRVLPGARFRRHLLFRYTIVWLRPWRGRRRR
jgi:2-polyprenyl-3-methyl-5-hydroxy-6-metoxy-1,4-benzoquinol methylase